MIHHPARSANILVFGYGNPSRGDDALGPLLLERLEPVLAEGPPMDVELLTDFQLQIEHTLDMVGREAVVFVDAHARCTPPWTFTPISASEERSYTTHALTPGALLRVFQDVHPDRPLPPCYLLSIRGYQFELGASLSPEATDHLASATRFMMTLLTQADCQTWHTRIHARDSCLRI